MWLIYMYFFQQTCHLPNNFVIFSTKAPNTVYKYARLLRSFGVCLGFNSQNSKYQANRYLNAQKLKLYSHINCTRLNSAQTVRCANHAG